MVQTRSEREAQAVEAVYAVAIGAEASKKRAAQLARSLEDLILADGLAPGGPLGSEEALASRFGVGRPAVREAMRILERRGSVRVRRGRGGGFVASAASADAVAAEVCLHLLASGVTAAEVAEARILLDELCALSAERLRPGPASVYLTPFILGLDMTASSLGRPPTDAPVVVAAHEPSRAEQIARVLVGELNARAAPGLKLGSERVIADRFHASPQVVRQAVRLLEDRGFVRSERGRGGGLVLQRPGGTAVVHAAHSYFAATAGSAAELRSILSDLKCINARLAASKASTADRRRLLAAADELRALAKDDPVAWLRAPRLTAELAANRVTGALAGALLAYQMRAFPAQTALARGFADDMARAFARVLETVAAGDPAAAFAAQRVCDQHIAAWAAAPKA